MERIIFLFYGVLIIIALFSAVFITYHVIKFSYRKQTAILTLAVFFTLFFILLSANLIFFFSIDWSRLFPAY